MFAKIKEVMEERRLNALCLKHSKIVAPSYDRVVTIQIVMNDVEMKKKCLEQLEKIITKQKAVVRTHAADFLIIECPDEDVAKALRRVYG